MRVMTAAQMKSNPDQYLPFVMAENYHDVASFCSREVEPMGKECGMVQVAALAECMKVKVVIEYMDFIKYVKPVSDMIYYIQTFLS